MKIIVGPKDARFCHCFQRKIKKDLLINKINDLDAL